LIGEGFIVYNPRLIQIGHHVIPYNI